MTEPLTPPSVKDYVIDVGERAVRTFAQTLAAYFGAGALDLIHADWMHALDLAAGAAVLSIITSMAAAPFGQGGTAAFTPTLVPRSLVRGLRARHAAAVTSPKAAPNWNEPGWYDKGGVLPSGLGLVVNNTGKSIPVVPLDDTQEIGRVTYKHLPEKRVEGKRLGRHVNHDPRSLSYLVPETTTPTTAMWTRRVPVFDQGDLGSCTGNAAAGVLGTDPFYATLPAGTLDNEDEAVSLYSVATKLDDYSGSYPPDDTGSDGLSVAKACQRAGLISGYQHITSVAAAQTAIKTGPFIVGANWYSSMDNPNADGLVKVSGSIRGGHEFECHGYDADKDLWWFTNSWGPDWGKDGTFCMSSASFARLLSEDGDATVFLPVAAPFPPTPEPPAPTPGPAPAPVPSIPADWVTWAKHVLTLKDKTRATEKVAEEIIAAAGQ